MRILAPRTPGQGAPSRLPLSTEIAFETALFKGRMILHIKGSGCDTGDMFEVRGSRRGRGR
jgi:hypothetical protein